MQNKDLFGYQNQGKNYDHYRPSYPQQIIDIIYSLSNKKDNYLDVGTGTGQLLFKLAPFFKYSLGTDISEKMIKSAQGKLSNQNIRLIQTDCLDTLDNYPKFDLITVSQALHWFPVQDFIKNAAKNLLTPQGKLVVVGYYRLAILSTSEKSFGDIYHQYFSAIESCSGFDQSDLYSQYPEPKYNFKDHFLNVKKQVIDYKLKIKKQNLLNYLKTYSMYNLFREKNPQKQDPIQTVSKRLEAQEQVILQSRYFIFICENPKQ